MTPAADDTLSITDPGDLIEAVRYLLQFQPTESLVVVGLSRGAVGRCQVKVTVRMDLPTGAVQRDEFDDIVPVLLGAGVREAVCVVFTDVFSADPRDEPRLEAVRVVVLGSLARADVTPLDFLVANRHQWWSLSCDDLRCCPAEGVARRGDSALIAAQATLAGLVALPDRQTLVARLATRPARQRAALTPLLYEVTPLRLAAVLALCDRANDDRAKGDRANDDRANDDWANGNWASDDWTSESSRPSSALTDREVAELARSLQQPALRDELWRRIDARVLDANSMLYQVQARVPAPFDGPALFLIGWASWRAGNGTLAAIAAHRALESDPDYTAASLLLRAISGGVNPHDVAAVATGR